MDTVKSFLDFLLYHVLIHIPGTSDRKVYRALSRGRVLYAMQGHIQICRVIWQWENEQEQQGNFFWMPACNADQLELGARAYLASMGRELEEGQFIKCPKHLARRASWE